MSRSFKNGFVWHDLAENDFIHPSHGNEYVLKGSELLDVPSSSSRPLESISFRSPRPSESDYPVVVRRRNQSWSSLDLNEYRVYKTESTSELTPKAAADAATQTDDKMRRRKQVAREKEEDIQELQEDECDERDNRNQDQATELSKEEISPPLSDSSPETLEKLMKADKRLMSGPMKEDCSNRKSGNLPGVRLKASSLLVQLISCGSLSFKDCGATNVKDQGLSLIGQYKGRLPRGRGRDDKRVGTSGEISSLRGLRLENKEYFSGSLIETQKKDEITIPSLKRSSSYNANTTS